MVKCRIVMPKHLKEEENKIWAIMGSRHDPDEEIPSKAFFAELDAIREKYGSPELRAWYKEQDELYEDKRRRGVELS
ncbi:MAG: hypothetical protein Q4B32_10520 [Clostridia bacterium]|nr:hypothetical protein [Clostridia bacterium]